MSLPEYTASVGRFLAFARDHPELAFDLTPVGTGLAGFTLSDLHHAIAAHGGLPSNVRPLF